MMRRAARVLSAATCQPSCADPKTRRLGCCLSAGQVPTGLSKVSSETSMEYEAKYGANNYSPLPCVFSAADRITVTDPEGKRYIDFLSAYSAVNQGHCHPKIVKAAQDQMEKCTLSSRAFFNDQYGQWAKFMCDYFNVEKVVPMNTGAEAVETGIKLARKWGYKVKKIPENEAIIVVCSENFHGRTIGIVSFSDDPEGYGQYGPFLPGFVHVKHGDITDLVHVMEQHGPKIAGFLVEPVQGEAGVVVPDDGYLKRAYEVCRDHDVLFIADEVQSGLGRTGKLLACDHDEVEPDMVLLGKALSGGVYPVSAVMTKKASTMVFEPGTHGSTYGGNPVAAATSVAALEVLRDENLTMNAAARGEQFRELMWQLVQPDPLLIKVRGRGLLNAVVVNDEDHPNLAKKWCLNNLKLGLLAKPTHGNIIRFAPPLCITEQEVNDAVDIIREGWKLTKKELGVA